MMKKKDEWFVRRIVRAGLSDSLYRNSIYMMISTLIMSFLGFVFWMIVTRLYSASDVGLATTIISVMGLITSFSLLGLNVGLIKYLPTQRIRIRRLSILH